MTVQPVDHHRVQRVERLVGRPLTAAEKHVDVEQINTLYERAKDLLTLEIQREQARLGRLIADGHTGHLDTTPRMLSILQTVRRHGAAHALNELHSMGYPVRQPRRVRKLVRSEDELAGRLHHRLALLSVKVEDAAIGVSIGDYAADAVIRAAQDVLGARSIAAEIVAPAFDAGLAETFDQHQDLVDRWQYSAVLDSATCDECSSLDGEIYESWDAISEVLPDGGPNPDCFGGDRCRCRPLPVPSG